MLLKKYFKGLQLVTLLASVAMPSVYATGDNKLLAYKRLIESTFKQVERSKSAMSAYKTTKVEDINGDISTVIATFDPRRAPESPWNLINIDGHEPSSEDIKDYLIEIDDSKPNEIIDFIDVSTLKIIAEDDNTVTLFFSGRNKKFGDAAIGKLDGSLIIDKQMNFPVSMTIVNNQKFSPKLILAIDHWRMEFNFARAGNLTIQTGQKAEMSGYIAMLTELKLSTLVTYSDYEHF